MKSILCYSLPFLINNKTGTHPTIPLLFFIHERKHEAAHFEFFQFVKQVLPELETHCYSCTDGEDAFRNAMTRTFTLLRLFRCWNHHLDAVERWLREMKAKQPDIEYYLSSLRELFVQTNEASFDLVYNKYIHGYTNEFDIDFLLGTLVLLLTIKK